MPKCKYCKQNITKFDKDICPFCGGEKPLDGSSSNTCDITQVIDTANVSSKADEFKQHSRVKNAVLMMILGVFGADAYYLGFYKEGTIRVLLNILIMGGLFCGLFFGKVFVEEMSLILSIVIPVGIALVVYLILGILNLFKKNKKDAKGVFLK